MKMKKMLLSTCVAMVAGMGAAKAQCTDIGAQEPIKLNGVSVTATLSGNANYGDGVTNIIPPACAPSIGATDGLTPILVPLSGNGTTGSITFYFSQPVNNIMVKFSGADSMGNAVASAEHLTFTTNEGTVTVTGSTCNETQSGNTFSANNDTQMGGGGGIVTVSSTEPYTSLTVTNVANPVLGGTYVVLCGNSVAVATPPSVPDCGYNTWTEGGVINGVTVTTSLSGGGNTLKSTYNELAYGGELDANYDVDECGDTLINFTTNPELVWLNMTDGINPTQWGSVTYNFSQPVNDITVIAGNPISLSSPATALTFTTNNGTVTTTASTNCETTKTGNTYTAFNTSNTGGGLIVTVHSDMPYTSLTVTNTGNSANNGTLVGLCSNSIMAAAQTTPVQYAQTLTGTANGSAVALQWATATEINNKGFEIQRSADGKTFSSIGFVASQADNGTSTKTLSYTYTDAAPLQGANYYRLLQTDLDGHTAASRTVSVNFSANGGLSVYPNPVHGIVTIAGLQAGENVSIYSANGHAVKSFTATSASQQVDVSSLAAGIYFLTTQSKNGQKTTVKFIVR